MKISHMSFVCLAALSILFMEACSRKAERFYEISMTDDSLKSVITEYVKTEHLDKKSSLVGVALSTVGGREIYEISYTKSDIYKFSNSQYYTFVSGYLVVISITRNEDFSSKNISNELEEVIKESGIELQDRRGVFHSPRWWFVSCDGSYSLMKRSRGLMVDYLPCPYEIRRLSVDSDSLILVKDRGWSQSVEDTPLSV